MSENTAYLPLHEQHRHDLCKMPRREFLFTNFYQVCKIFTTVRFSYFHLRLSTAQLFGMLRGIVLRSLFFVVMLNLTQSRE